MKGERSGVTAEWLWRTVSWLCGCAQLRQHKDVIEDTFNLFIHSFIHKIRWFQISTMPLLCGFSINNIFSPWLLAKEGKGWKVGSRALGCLLSFLPWHPEASRSLRMWCSPFLFYIHSQRASLALGHFPRRVRRWKLRQSAGAAGRNPQPPLPCSQRDCSSFLQLLPKTSTALLLLEKKSQLTCRWDPKLFRNLETQKPQSPRCMSGGFGQILLQSFL